MEKKKHNYIPPNRCLDTKGKYILAWDIECPKCKIVGGHNSAFEEFDDYESIPSLDESPHSALIVN